VRRAILLLVNPQAGGKPGSGPDLAEDPARLAPEALAAGLRERGLVVWLHELAEHDDAGGIAAGAASGDHDVVVAGGDGTVASVAAALVGHPAASLGILALGSFNNIARGFGVPSRLDPALDVIATGRADSVDVGWIGRGGDDGRPFFEAAGVGLDAVGFLAAEVAERHGWARAARALWRGLRLRRTPMRITIDGVVTETRSPAVTVSNGPYHGLGFAISANADPADGRLDVAVFEGMGRWEVLGHFASVARRRTASDPRVRQWLAREVRIEGLRHALPAHADGVSVGVTPIDISVRQGALRLFR
jgi:diacylglycerol kinase (ATP)